MRTLTSPAVVPFRSRRSAALTVLQAQLYQEGRERRPIARLFPWLLDRRNLEAAWLRVRDAEGAGTPGPDGVTADEAAGQLATWLARIADDLLHHRYRFLAPRWVEIPKPNKPGQFRRLGILALRDRVVLAACKQVLEPVLDPVFLAESFGFRPGHSVPGALEEAVRRLSPRPGGEIPFPYAVHLDVADCFDTVDHRLLLGELTRHVSDGDLLRLVEQALQTGGTTVGQLFWRRSRGLVQGSSLSPLLCNLALHPLDLALRDLGRSTQEGVWGLRYADDLLLLARDERLADRGIRCVRQVLGGLQQQLRTPVAAATSISQGVEWLGVRLQPRQHRWGGRTRVGYVVPDAKVESMLERLTEMTVPPCDRIDGAAFNLGRWITSINEQLRDWREAYQFADNAAEVFRVLDEHCRERVGELLLSVTGVRRVQLGPRFRARLPRGFWTWEVPAARLVVLSSLAPRNPCFLTRRPAWMERGLVEEPKPAPATPVLLPGPQRDAPAAAGAASDPDGTSTDATRG